MNSVREYRTRGREAIENQTSSGAGPEGMHREKAKNAASPPARNDFSNSKPEASKQQRGRA